MQLPIVSSPAKERWDCHSCGNCCRGLTVMLDDEDLRKLDEQRWEEHLDFQHTPVVISRGLLSRERMLAQRDDGRCVFLGEDGLCRIHAEFGAEAKPWACQLYPFQLVPAGKRAVLTVRRSCPSAAADRGRLLDEHRAAIRPLAARALPPREVPPPELAAGFRSYWKTTLVYSDALSGLVCDGGLPIVRRLAHGLQFANLLADCRLKKLTSQQIGELPEILSGASREGVGEWFSERKPPSRSAAVLFRQTAAEYVRLHPNLGDRPGLSERWRLLRAAMQIARGRGQLPEIVPGLATATFDALEQPRGALPTEVLQPIARYFETMTAALHYCGSGRFGWSLVDGFRALALAYPVAMWALRWMSVDREPTAQDAVDVVALLDRSHFYPLLGGSRHRRRVRTLAQLGELGPLLAWYAQ